MKKKLTIWLIAMIVTIPSLIAQNIPLPETFFGFKPGADNMLFTYEKLTDYLKKANDNTKMMKMVEIGQSPMGKPMYAVFISSEENIKNLDNLKEINRKLALDYTLTNDEENKLAEQGKVFVLATLSMHSNEVGPTQALPLIVYQLLTDKSEELTKILNDVVYMVVPCHNPDGMDMVVEYFNKNKGTKYDGSAFPGLYHKYIGHDNNRDFITLTQSDTKAISALTSSDWFPQVMVEKHQMGYMGARLFVPPFHDPISENLEADLFNWNGLFGQNMVNDLTSVGLKGVSQHNSFDNYWPGSTETCIWKNVISFLTEAASVKLAKPIYIEPTELASNAKGLPEYKKGINMLSPWPGGWWRLSDIVDMEIASTTSMLNTAHLYKDRILKFRNDICKEQVEKGKTEAPYYYIIPKNQVDLSELVALVELLKEHGIHVFNLMSDVTINNTIYSAGDIVVPLAQPFRMFIKEVLESQKYPVRRFTPGGEIIEPYDITTWSLPLHKGLNCDQIDIRDITLENSIKEITDRFSLSVPIEKGKYAILTSTNNQSYNLAFTAIFSDINVDRTTEDLNLNGIQVPKGSFIVENSSKLNALISTATYPIYYIDSKPNCRKIKKPRIAFIESTIQSTDAGWTRFVLDSYGIKYNVMHPSDVESSDLKSNYDLIIIPNTDASILKDGKYKRNDQVIPTDYPPEYTKGMGTKGIETLMDFVNNGGNIIAWENAVELFEGNLTIKTNNLTEEFRLPFRNVGKDLEKKGVECPGSLIKMILNQDSPLTWGMKNSVGIFYRGKPVFTTQVPNLDMDRRIIGYFGQENLLLSGYLKGEELLASKTAMVWIQKGKGQMILLAFSPTFRASVPATYKLLFNSILMDKN